MANQCMICAQPMRARLIEADWAGGMSTVGIAKGMTENGWPIASGTVLKHLKEHVEGAAQRKNTPIRSQKRDAALFVRDIIIDEIEMRQRKARLLVEAGEDVDPNLMFDPLHKDNQPALKTAIAAEGLVAKREDNAVKRKIDLFQLMLGGADGTGALAPKGLIGDGFTIEGEFKEVTDDGSDAS